MCGIRMESSKKFVHHYHTFGLSLSTNGIFQVGRCITYSIGQKSYQTNTHIHTRTHIHNHTDAWKDTRNERDGEGERENRHMDTPQVASTIKTWRVSHTPTVTL